MLTSPRLTASALPQVLLDFFVGLRPLPGKILFLENMTNEIICQEKNSACDNSVSLQAKNHGVYFILYAFLASKSTLHICSGT
jgi:hypothetical protein